MEAKRLMVKQLFDRGFSAGKIFMQLKTLGFNRTFIYRTINRLLDTNSCKDRPRSGRPRTVRTKKCIKRIREKIRRNPQRSANKMAAEENMSRRTMQLILNEDLGFRPYRKRKVQGLTTAQIVKRLQRCKKLLNRHGSKSVEKIIFSDEKLFCTEQSYNAKNDVVYSATFEDIPENFRTVKRFQNKNSVMVWAAVSHNGKLPLKFIDKGVKINAEYYKQEVLTTHLLPHANRLYPKKNWIFQQDSAPSHRSKTTQKWLQANCPKLIKQEDWPPSSPDLNPLDYCIWGILESKVNAKQHRSLDTLKASIRSEWDKLPLKVIRAAIGQWRKRLSLVIDNDGGRFE